MGYKTITEGFLLAHGFNLHSIYREEFIQYEIRPPGDRKPSHHLVIRFISEGMVSIFNHSECDGSM